MKKRSRRFQPGKRVFLFSLLLALILILIISTIGRQEFSAPHKFTMEIIGTAQYGITKASNSFRHIWDRYINLVNTHDENKKLRETLRQYQAINAQYREAAAVNIHLSKLLGLKEALPVPTLTAQVIGKDPSQWFKTIIINRGSSDGVRKNMPVVTAEGVVGQVMNTSPHYAKVLLAKDPNSAIDGLIQKNRTQGIIKGRGNAGYEMYYVLKSASVQRGDIVVTSGLGGVFPKGLPIGTITDVAKARRGMFQNITILPSVDFLRLEELIIIMGKSSLAE